MIYATDLDRTLIFSENFIKENPSDTKAEITETLNGKVISYAAAEVLEALKRINESKSIKIVPVTSRSLAEYKRVDLGVGFEYAITANGGLILHNGSEMPEWNFEIKKLYNSDMLLNLAEKLNSLKSLEYKAKIIDDTYVFTKTPEAGKCFPELNELKEQFKEIEFTLQVKKLYAVPKNISKAKALMWLKEFLNESIVVASGDSELDAGMLQAASLSISPDHGSIVQNKLLEPDYIVSGGILSPLRSLFLAEQINVLNL